MNNARLWRHFDFWLLGSVIVLVIFGIAMIRSATLEVESLKEMVPRQTIYGAIGLGVVFLMAAIDYRFWSSLSGYIYVFVVLALGIVFVSGTLLHGATRWLDAGLFLIQPSELAKILMTRTLSAYVARHQGMVKSFKGILWSLAHMAIPAGMVFLQPDLSTAILFMVIWFTILWTAGIRLAHLGVLLLIGLLAIPVAWQFLEPYQKGRIAIFLNSELDPDARYNIQQALIAIGSGGLFGQGYGHGTQVQLHFLRVRPTDFLFSVIAQEFGLVGTLAMIALIMFVVYRCVRAGQLSRDRQGAYICYGMAMLIFYQASFNIGMNMNLLPVAGLPLPFISYGGSTLLALLMGVGIVESVVLRHRQIEF